jgi:hypothetical protein
MIVGIGLSIAILVGNLMLFARGNQASWLILFCGWLSLLATQICLVRGNK